MLTVEQYIIFYNFFFFFYLSLKGLYQSTKTALGVHKELQKNKKGNV